MTKFLMYQIYLVAQREGLKSASELLYILAYLGVDCVFIGPIHDSPGHDHGYDVSDYKHINPKYGTMRDFDEFVEKAHNLGIKVVIDLVLNHTSTEHPWFREHPDYYCWEGTNHSDWRNLFNHGAAWEFDEVMGKYYLHLFHEKQADLNWFPDGEHINRSLVQEFRKIVEFWTSEHGVDGFRLGVPQAINKTFSIEDLVFSDLLFGNKAAEVISAVFPSEHTPLLIMECFDPTFGGLTRYYTENTPVDFVMNVLVKDTLEDGEFKYSDIIKSSTKYPQFMLNFEDHDSMRFPSRPSMTPEESLWRLFNSGANAICLYQGQELGLENPSKEQLPDELMLKLDAKTMMQFISGKPLDELRPRSRANARVPILPERYREQMAVPGSYLSLTKMWIDNWRKSKSGSAYL